MDRDSRTLRIVNVVIMLGAWFMITFMMVNAEGGAETFLSEWLRAGLPWFLLGLAVIAWRAPRYIRGEQSR